MRKITLMAFVLAMVLSANVFAISEWDKAVPASTDKRIDYPADQVANNEAVDRLVKNYRSGMNLAYSSATTLTVSSGEVTCSNAAGTVRRFRSNGSSTNVTFGNIDAGAEAAGTTYYVYAVGDADSEAATFMVSLSGSAPTGATYYKRLGSFYNNASSDIDQTLVTNDNFYSASNIYDSGWFSVTTSSGTITKTHGLGTNKMHVTMYMSASSAGTNPWLVQGIYGTDNGAKGLSITDITNTAMTVQASSDAVGFIIQGGNDGLTNYTSAYLRIIATVVK